MSIAKKRININNMLTKKFWLIIGALAVLCAGVIGINAYFSKKIPTSETPKKIIVESITPPEESTSTVSEEIRSTSEIDTSDWRTFRNEEYGFEIKYPANWYVRKAHGLEAILFLDVDETKVIPIGGVGITPDYYQTGKEENQEPVEWIGFEVIVYTKPPNFTWDKWVKNNFPEMKGYKDYRLNDLHGVELIGSNGIVRGWPSIFVTSNSKIYRVTSFCNTSAQQEEGLKIFNQMVTILKFIE